VAGISSERRLSNDQNQESIYERARALMPAGIGGQSQYRQPHPIYLSRAKGSRIYDTAGTNTSIT
jgi:glutamate-1-semialdehyde aminotransferase